MKSIINIGFGLWIVLFALFLPFTYNFIPEIGIHLTNGLSGISEWIATSIFGTEIYASPSTSDSVAQFVQSFLLLIVAFLIAGILQKQRRFSQDQIIRFLHTFSAYILSFFLLKYGVDKLFQFQFYAPEPNTLFTPLGNLSKDILFWSSMGTSSAYNTFMGLIEVIPAFLLLHNRTRLVGGLIALGVLINVLMINIGFDITVKLLSIYLVIVSLYVITPSLKSVFSFFILDQSISKPEMSISLKPKVRAILKSIIVMLLFTEVMLSYVQMGSFNGRELEKITHYGTYELLEKGVSIYDHNDIRRIHIHSKGYFILEDENGRFFDFPMQIVGGDLISVRGELSPILVNHNDPMTSFTIQGNGKVQYIISIEIDLDKLPARDDSFHWTVDGMVGDVK